MPCTCLECSEVEPLTLLVGQRGEEGREKQAWAVDHHLFCQALHQHLLDGGGGACMCVDVWMCMWGGHACVYECVWGGQACVCVCVCARVCMCVCVGGGGSAPAHSSPRTAGAAAPCWSARRWCKAGQQVLRRPALWLPEGRRAMSTDRATSQRAPLLSALFTTYIYIYMLCRCRKPRQRYCHSTSICLSSSSSKGVQE